MNHKNFDNFISSLKSIAMTASEKSTLRQELASFVVSYEPVKSPYARVFSLLQRGFAFTAVIVFSLATFSNAATKNSLPGDTFYPVKIAHEEIALATTFGATKKINYEIRRTEKRINEATELVKKQDLDSKTKISIAENIKKQTSKVKQHIQDVKIQNPEEALLLSSELQQTVQASKDVLREVANNPEIVLALNIPDPSEGLNTSLTPNQKVSSNTPAEKASLQEEGTLSLALVAKTSPLNTQEPIPEAKELSFAQSLLESLDQEVLEIQAFKDSTQSEMIQKADEVSALALAPKVLAEKAKSTELEKMYHKIAILQDIIDTKKAIQESMTERKTLSEDSKELSEQELRHKEKWEKADELITQQEYQQALVLLTEILDAYKKMDSQEPVRELSETEPSPSLLKKLNPSPKTTDTNPKVQAPNPGKVSSVLSR